MKKLPYLLTADKSTENENVASSSSLKEGTAESVKSSSASSTSSASSKGISAADEEDSEAQTYKNANGSSSYASTRFKPGGTYGVDGIDGNTLYAERQDEKLTAVTVAEVTTGSGGDVICAVFYCPCGQEGIFNWRRNVKSCFPQATLIE